MTSEGRKYCIQRLFDAPDLAALKRTWESFGAEYQRDSKVQEVKEQMKAKLK